MMEAGQRELTRVRHIDALAGVLNVSPLFLPAGGESTSVARQQPIQTVPFPARTDRRTLARTQLDTRMTGEWLIWPGFASTSGEGRDSELVVRTVASPGRTPSAGALTRQ